MTNTNETKITILGGGPGGLLLARLLTLGGVTCEVLETDLAVDSRHQGGMLDIHEDTGQVALRRAGLYDPFRAAVLEDGDALRILDPDAVAYLEQPADGRRPEIDRGSLRKLLAASLPDGVVRWNTPVKSVRRADLGFRLTLANGQEESAEIVVGADGAWSRVRPILTDATPAYSGITFFELRFQDAPNRYPTAKRLVGGGMMLALGDNRGFMGHREPEGEVSLYAAVRLPEAAARSVTTATDLLPYFADWHPDYRTLLTHNDGFAVRLLYALPTGQRWARVPGATLLGDAAHLMAPTGDGVNQAFADAADLAEQISLHPGDLETAFAVYEERMFKRTAEIAAESGQMLELLISPDPLPELLRFFSSMGQK